MAGQIEPIARMAQQLSRLPGIGAKTAQRLAYHIVSLPEDQVHELASAIWQGRKAVNTARSAATTRWKTPARSVPMSAATPA